MVATLVAICSLGVQAQELTTNQVAILNKQAADEEQAAKKSALMAEEAYSKLSPLEKELRALEAEQRAAEFEKYKEIITPPEAAVRARMQQELSAKSTLSSTEVSSEVLATLSEGDIIMSLVNGNSGGEQLLSFGDCGSDPNQFYNLPLFTAVSGTTWLTQNAPTTYYSWALLTPNGNDASGRAAATSGNFSANFSSSYLYTSTSNNFDVYGVPLRHRLAFKYRFSKSNVNDVFRVQVGGNFYVTNLPTAGSWTRIVLDIPAFPISTTTAEIRFTVFKESTSSSSPHGDIYATAWCTEVRSTNINVNITRSGTNNLVWWNHETAPTNYWQLIFSPLTVDRTNALWSTNIGVPIIVHSNTIATATIPANSSQRYYSLKRRF